MESNAPSICARVFASLISSKVSLELLSRGGTPA
jgi:hypothetical protein